MSTTPLQRARSAESAISRREAIRRAAVLAGVVFAPSWLVAAEQARVAAAPRYFTADQFALLTAMAERIMPATDTPGASDVGVPAFLDLLYGEFMTSEEQQGVMAALTATAAASRAAHGRLFPTLTSEQQDAVLQSVAVAAQAAEQAPGASPSGFRRFRAAVVLGYFTSEEVGRNVLHYDPIPGRLDACVPIEDVGRRNWTT